MWNHSTFTAKGPGWIPGSQGTKILQAMLHGQKKKKEKRSQCSCYMGTQVSCSESYWELKNFKTISTDIFEVPPQKSGQQRLILPFILWGWFFTHRDESDWIFSCYPWCFLLQLVECMCFGNMIPYSRGITEDPQTQIQVLCRTGLYLRGWTNSNLAK